MNLCHIVPSLEQQHGGPSRSVRALCRALAGLEHDVSLLSTEPAAPCAGTHVVEGRLTTQIFPRDWPQRLCPSLGLRRAMDAAAPQIVHHHALWLRTLHYAHMRARRSDLPLVVSPRGMMSAWAWRHRGLRKRISRALIHPGALDAVRGWHATSTEEAAEIRALGFKQPICVAPNGVDAPASGELDVAGAHWRETCPEVNGRRVALFYSRFHQKKRVLELIDLWLEHGPKDWLLLLAGIPEDYTPEMLEAYVRKMSGGGRVRVFDGAGRPAPYAVASLFLLPSHNENFGLVVAEAMAHGVPVLVTDTTPWRQINDRQLGWCVPWEKFGATLAQVTQQADQSLRQRGRAAQAWVLREFAWERAAATLTDFYARLLANGR